MDLTKRIFMGLAVLLLAGLMVTTSVSVAEAGVQLPNGTTSLEDIRNALDSETEPQSAGEMSVEWTNTTGGDTQFADSAGLVVTSVDTGYDVSANVDDVEGNQPMSAGDSVTYTIPFRNKGNNANPVPFTVNLSDSEGTFSSFTTEGFVDSNNNDQFDTGTDNRINVNGDSTVFLAENEAETIFVVVTGDSNASNSDTQQNNLFLTDNAPSVNGNPGLTGDQWEDSSPIAVADSNDTQNVAFTTTIQGPVLTITKSLSRVSGSARPGDTIAYTMTITNTGGDTASNVSVFDAMPDSTTLVDTAAAGNGDDAYDVTNNGTLTTEHDNTLTGDFTAAGATPENTERLRIRVPDVGPSDSVQVRFWVRID